MNQEPNPLSSPPQTQQKPRRTVLRAVLPAVTILVLSAAGILYGQRVVDRIQASRYDPTAQMSAVTQRLDMTQRGIDVLYATKPIVEAKAEFNNNCHSEERTAAILGCYYRDRIYLYDIKNTKLDGTLEVTAAHEMLHAAYQRLNFFERSKVDQLIERQYAKLKDDENLKEVMKYYEKAEPGAEINELHSILGTTVAQLDPELDRYYAQYFKDRAKVVALNAAYNNVFGDLKRQATVLEAKVKAAEPKIKEDLATYETDHKQIESDIASFNEQAKSGAFTSRSAFSATRSALLARVDALNARRDAINVRVAAYNEDVAALNALSTEASELYKSINGAETASGV